MWDLGEAALSPLSRFEREEHEAAVAREVLIMEYRALKTKNQSLKNELESLETAYAELVAENAGLENTCTELAAAEEATWAEHKDLQAEMEEMVDDHGRAMEELQGQYWVKVREQERTAEQLEALQEARDAGLDAKEEASSSPSRSQVAHLQTQYDNLLEAYKKLETSRRDDAKRWVGMKNGLDAEIHRLKSALKKERQKNAAVVGTAGELAGRKAGHADGKVDENSQDKTRAGKNATATTKKETGTGDNRAPLRSIFTPGSQGVEDVVVVTKREEVRPAERSDRRDDRTPADPARQIENRHSTSRAVPSKSRKTAVADVFMEIDQATGSSSHRERSTRTLETVGKTSSSDRDMNMAEEVLVLDSPAKRTRRDDHGKDEVGGSATEEDEEPRRPNRTDRPDRDTYIGTTSDSRAQQTVLPRTRAPKASVASKPRTTDPQTPAAVVATSRSTRTADGKAVDAMETPVAGPSRQPTSVARTGSRITRTPSGMQWLGGEKTKLTRRDSFEDEVGTSSRAKVQGDVLHTLPRIAAVKPSTTMSVATTSKLPGSSRHIGRDKEDQNTPTRAPHATLKRKQIVQSDTPTARPTDTPARSEKRPKLTATTSRRLEDPQNNEVYVINPEKNQGKKFAYHSVQRGKEERRCMDGEACEGCDNWWHATRDMQLDAGIRFGRYSPSPDELIDQDQEELAQAQKQKIMNTVSRHKAEHEKNPTPPGYWEPGMPSTQAVERQNAAADEMLKAKRAKQQKEAEKADGKWMVLGKNNDRTPRMHRPS